MTRFIVLTDAELDALQGEPAEVFKFYVCLRRRMDRNTGLVGATVGISWQALREDMYVEPRAGRQVHGSPSEKFVRMKAQRLAEIGLVESQTTYRKLVFLLPLAHRKQVRSNLIGQTWGRQEGQEEGQTSDQAQQGFPGVMGQEEGQTENGLMGHTSEFRVNPLSVVNGIPAPCPEVVDNSAGNSLMVVAADLAGWLRKAERARGCIAKVSDSETTVLDWARDGVTLEQLQAAYDEAKWSREKQNNPQPINAPFLDAIVRRRLGGRMVSRKSEAVPSADVRQRVWYMTEEGILAKAAALGIERLPDEASGLLMIRCLEAESQKGKRDVRR